MLKPEKRHTAACVAQRRKKNPTASEYDPHARCTCNYRAIGMLGGTFVRKALKTANNETALETIFRGVPGRTPASAPVGRSYSEQS
jgi:hypothetical protein